MTKPRVGIWEVRGRDDMGTRFWILDESQDAEEDDQSGERVHGEKNLILAMAYARGLCADSYITGANDGIHLDLDPDKAFDPLDFVGALASEIYTAYLEGRESRVIFEDVQ